MERIGRTHCEQLKLRTAGYLSRSGGSERHANVGLIGGNVVSTGYDGARAIRLERGRADTEPAISEAEWNLRRPHRQSSGREHRVDNLPEPRIVGRLPVVAGADGGLECARIESGNSGGVQRQ